MDAKKYFKKTGAIYGDSSKYEYGIWKHRITKFDNWEEAEKWLNTEEYDFRERELISANRAKHYGYQER